MLIYIYKQIDDKKQKEEDFKMTQKHFLNPKFDSAKSFYGKATVEKFEDDFKQLRSYNTIVATIDGDHVEVLKDQSKTTLRHIREFLLQNNFKAGTKKEIENQYGVNTLFNSRSFEYVA